MLSRRSPIYGGDDTLAVIVRLPIVKDRILIHLLDYRQFAEEIEVPLEMTHEGIAQAVWIDVRHVAQYVRPLIAQGLARERTTHVRGGRRRRKVYDLTDSGKLTAYQLRKKVASEVVRIRDTKGLHEASVSQVLEETKGKMSILDILRQAVHAGAVDLAGLEFFERKPMVEMLSDAPHVGEFVGRGKELEVITKDGELPRLFVVRGVAGIGKSTLAAKACEVWRGSQNLFWHRMRPWDTPQTILAALGTFLAALGKPALRAVLTEGRAPEIAPQVLRDELPEIKAILVLDDAHEASPKVLHFLRFVKDAIAESKNVKALVLTRRTLPFFDRRDVVVEGLVREMDLGGLEPKEVEAILPAEEEPILRDMGRHPLFLRLLRSAPGRKASVEALRDIHRFIEEAVYAELSKPERKMMKIASLYKVPVARQAFFFDETLSHDVLMALMDRALIVPVGDEGLEAHDTIRDFFTSVLTSSERRRLGAFAIEKLSEHASNALNSGDIPSYIDYLSNAVQLAPQGAQLLWITEALGDAKEEIGDLKGGMLAYKEALKAEAEAEHTARLHRKIASGFVVQGEIPAAVSQIEEGFVALGQAVNVERGWLNLVRCRISEWLEEWEEAREYGLTALDIFQAFGELHGQGQALLLLADVETKASNGQLTSAQRYLEEALELTDSIADAEFTATVHGELAYSLAFRFGRVEEAAKHLAHIDTLLDASVESLRNVKFLTLNAGFNLIFRADYQLAEAIFEEAMSLGRKYHSPYTVALAKHGLALVAYYQGRFDEACRGFREFALSSRDQNLLAATVESMCMAAECCLLEGDLDGFRQIVAALEDETLARGVEARPMMTKVITAVDLFLRGDHEKCYGALREALVHAEGGLVSDPSVPHLISGAILKVLGRDAEAAEYLKTARETLETHSRRAALAILSKRERVLTKILDQATAA